MIRKGIEGRTYGTGKYPGILEYLLDSYTASLVLTVYVCTCVHMWVCMAEPPGT